MDDFGSKKKKKSKKPKEGEEGAEAAGADGEGGEGGDGDGEFGKARGSGVSSSIPHASYGHFNQPVKRA